MSKSNLKINTTFWKKYKFFCFFVSYSLYYHLFEVWFFVRKQFFWKLYSWVSPKSIELIYVLFLLFLKSVLIDFVTDFYIMFIEENQLVLLGEQLLQRVSRTVVRVVSDCVQWDSLFLYYLQ